MIWNLLENRANTAMHYTSSIGRIWIINQFLFRMLIVTVIGSQVFGDEQGKFLCDTDQPGCKNVCFNRFSPISYLRLWAFQIVATSMPKFVFYSYIDLVKSIQILTQKEKEDSAKEFADTSLDIDVGSGDIINYKL